MKSRLAPTPSGYLHIGNILSFCLTDYLARSYNAPLLLRIDDMDSDRVRPQYLEDIFSSLLWLGFHWEEGPITVADFEQQYSQRHRLPLYEKALTDLRDSGCLFACTCSRKTADLCSCLTKGISFEQPGVQWRINTAGAGLSDSLNNFVVRKKDGMPAYQLCSVVDDLHFRVTLVVRGEDLRDSTRAQLFLASRFPANDFSGILFFHHPLILGANGSKLSKSAGATSVQYLREKNPDRRDLFRLIGRSCGLGDAIDSKEAVAQAFLQSHPFTGS
ncbi:glutamate--tRNA ligase family protein [Flavihumibacter petaseus]|uniref:Glutamyl-Q tRNA(Asp) synthetase n=1 Tax=Flavihumibacter petaseus NBRC 106054 TaxID=1220578 RepID=A0A0E9MV91_9BACT|nr:glutamate--tRNA ligase family protein [Flavihumibacter petaseus]GAO41045.1 glutamyl-Q tRNA(Asp) synthetase [Flavihumibacter petaseus NBRC 106054]